MAKEKSIPKRWYNRYILLLLFSLLAFPLGLYGLWKSEVISKIWKVIFAVIILFVYVPYLYRDWDSRADRASSSDLSRNLSSTPEQIEKVIIPRYSVIKEEKMPPYKIAYDIRIDQEYSKSELELIRAEILEDTEDYDRTFILFYLPGMKVDAGAWARGHSEDGGVEIMDYMWTD